MFKERGSKDAADPKTNLGRGRTRPLNLLFFSENQSGFSLHIWTAPWKPKLINQTGLSPIKTFAGRLESNKTYFAFIDAEI